MADLYAQAMSIIENCEAEAQMPRELRQRRMGRVPKAAFLIGKILGMERRKIDFTGLDVKQSREAWQARLSDIRRRPRRKSKPKEESPI